MRYLYSKSHLEMLSLEQLNEIANQLDIDWASRTQRRLLVQAILEVQKEMGRLAKYEQGVRKELAKLI